MITAYLAHLAFDGKRPNTIEVRRKVLGSVDRRVAPLDELTKTQALEWLAGYASPQTRASYLAHLRSFYAWATREDLLTVNPVADIRTPKVPRRVPRPMPETALREAVGAAVGQQRAWLVLSAYVGLRGCEIAPMRGEHVLRGAVPTLYIPEQKGGGEGYASLPAIVLDELDRWPRRGRLWDVTADQISARSARFLRGLGLDVTLHQGRHRFGTQVYRASGHDLRMTQEALRHLSPASTAIYTAVDPAETAAVLNRLPGVA